MYSSTNMICGSGGNTRKGKFLNANSEVHKDQVFGTRLKADFIITTTYLKHSSSFTFLNIYHVKFSFPCS